jgi:hypothetical protein
MHVFAFNRPISERKYANQLIRSQMMTAWWFINMNHLFKDIMVNYDGTAELPQGCSAVHLQRGWNVLAHTLSGNALKPSTSTLRVRAQMLVNYWVDMTDPTGRFLPGVLQVGIDDGSLELQA